MRHSVSIIIFVLLLSCGARKKSTEYGSVSGNVFWKYNEYVGNKADAGSKITLYSTTDSSLSFRTTADIQGNYKIDSIPTGQYLLIVNSKNTTDDPVSHVSRIRLYSDIIEKLSNKKFPESVMRDIKRCLYYDSLHTQEIFADKPLKKQINYRDSAKKEGEKAISSLPSDIMNLINLYSSYGKKLEFEYVKVEKGRNSTIVTDFGITYF